MINTPYQAKYIVHELERVYANDDVAKISGLMFDAQIQPTPHQIDAALFALDSPNTRGAILADEVGLGKTIEAGIVIMQNYAERRRNILIVTPSSLRQQWKQELEEKFNLSALLIDAKSMKQKNTIDTEGIYICSYEFASRNVPKLTRGWDLIVLDEAHKLRNFYSNKQGIANAISDIAKSTSKALLLTATPLQNRLEELYGLVSVVDPGYFYSLNVFKERYIKSDHPYALLDLRERMSKIAKRTLRLEAKKYIKYTDRNAKTITFEPSGEEKKLYELVDDYLHRDKLYAFAASQRQLSALILRKRLGSSTFAVASTLRKIVIRMENEYAHNVVRDNRGGLTQFDDLSSEEIEAFEESGEIDNIALNSAQERAEFKAEIDELKTYVDLAESITSNVKAERLIDAINVGFNTLASKAARKAIIFTESTVTQEYIANVLESQGFKSAYVTFNGQNNSPMATEIYRKWVAKNKDSDLVTGIESADRRKALIDRFQEDDIQIMIATEAASEGINLQFCSMLINYDLPWNPQRVEQRIGRIHRMGQKFDVVVVNFSNEGNTAEKRILELLANKFNLFKSTFGVSNDVLGAIENGLDFERKISIILNTCRTDEEISRRFGELQQSYKDEISSEQLITSSKIFDSLDPYVQDRFQRHSERAAKTFNSFERMFMMLTQYELRGVAEFENDRVFRLNMSPTSDTEEGLYFFKTDRVAHARRYKYAGTLARYVRASARNAHTPPARLTFNTSSSDRVSTDVKKLVGKSGTLVVESVTFPMKAGVVDMSESYIVAAGETSDGTLLDAEACRSLLELTVRKTNTCSVSVSRSLNEYVQQQTYEFHHKVKERNTDTYLDKKDILERQYKDKLIEYEMKADKLNVQIREKEKRERQTTSSTDRLKLASEKQVLRKKIRELNREKYHLEDRMDDEISEKITLARQASEGDASRERLFEVEFEVN